MNRELQVGDLRDPSATGINKPGHLAENIFESLEGTKKRVSKVSDFNGIP